MRPRRPAPVSANAAFARLLAAVEPGATASRIEAALRGPASGFRVSFAARAETVGEDPDPQPTTSGSASGGTSGSTSGSTTGGGSTGGDGDDPMPVEPADPNDPNDPGDPYWPWPQWPWPEWPVPPTTGPSWPPAPTPPGWPPGWPIPPQSPQLNPNVPYPWPPYWPMPPGWTNPPDGPPVHGPTPPPGGTGGGGSSSGGTGGGSTGGTPPPSTPPPGGYPPPPVVPPQAPPTGSTVGYDDASWQIRLGMAWSPGEFVTGTKVECGFMFMARSNWLLQANPPAPTYSSVTLNAVRFHISDGTRVVDLPAITPTSSPVALPSRRTVPYDPKNPDDPSHPWWQEQPPDYVYYPVFRFASTHYPDNTPLTIWGEASVTLANGSVYRDLTVLSPLYSYTVYNKGLTLATQQWFDIKKKVYTTETTPTPEFYDWASGRAVAGIPDANGNLDPAGTAYDVLAKMNHSLLGPTDGILPGDGLLAKLGDMTAFLAFTHGEQGCLLGSCVPGAPTDAAKLYYNGGANSQVGRAVWHDPSDPTKPRRAPRPNLVVLHACSGLQEGQAIGQAFGILQPGQIFDDTTHKIREGRAYAGFTDVVNTPLTFDKGPQASKPHYLDDHARLVYKHLLDGWTIMKAVDDANGVYGPQGLRLEQGNTVRFLMYMKYKVDPYTRLMGVYRDEDARVYTDQEGKLTWSLILPPIPWTQPPDWWWQGLSGPPSNP